MLNKDIFYKVLTTIILVVALILGGISHQEAVKIDNLKHILNIDTIIENAVFDKNGIHIEGWKLATEKDTKLKVYIDNELVDSSNYELSKGSTIVTFNDEYTKLLATGEHTLKVAVDDGEIETKFTIAKSKFTSNDETTSQTSDDTKSTTTTSTSSSPKTGDNITLWISLALVGLFGKKEISHSYLLACF